MAVTQRTIFLNGDTDMKVTVEDGEDGLGDETTFALSLIGSPEVYIHSNDWEKIKKAVDDYFAEMEAEDV